MNNQHHLQSKPRHLPLVLLGGGLLLALLLAAGPTAGRAMDDGPIRATAAALSLIHISEPTRPY